jgi:hypothetical protein
MRYIAKFLFFLLAGILGVSCSHQKSIYHYSALNGKIKSVHEINYLPTTAKGKTGQEKISDSGENKASFDPEGKCLNVEYFKNKSRLSGKLHFEYENGKLTKELFYDEKGRLIFTKNYYEFSPDLQAYTIHDKKGVKTEEGKYYVEKNKIVRQEKTTFDKNTVIEETSIVNTYDRHGDLIKQEQIRKKGNNIVLDYEYLEFDKKKNWTKRLEKQSSPKDGEDIITVRELEYY